MIDTTGQGSPSGGGSAVGLVAIGFAALADRAGAAMDRLIARAWWTPLLLTPAGFAAIAWDTQRLTPAAAGSGIPQIIAAKADPERDTLPSRRRRRRSSRSRC